MVENWEASSLSSKNVVIYGSETLLLLVYFVTGVASNKIFTSYFLVQLKMYHVKVSFNQDFITDLFLVGLEMN